MSLYDNPVSVLLKTEPSIIADTNWRAYERVRDAGHLKWAQESAMFDKYYQGEQWEDDVVSLLDSEKRPHQTINLILSTINAVLGEQINSRRDIMFKPRGKGANQGSAHALNRVIAQIEDNNSSNFNETQVFTDGCITDRGYWDIRMDFADNIQGEVRETVLNGRDVLLDPNASEYDPKTWQEVFVTKWLTIDEISTLYGEDKAKKLMYVDVESSYGMDSIHFDQDTFAQDTASGESLFMGDEYGEEWRRVRRIRVIERQYRRMGMQKFFVDQIQGDTRKVPESWDDQRISQFAQRMNLLVIRKPERKVRITVSADRCLLFDGWSLYKSFTVVPFFPFFRRGRPFGLVRNLVSPQDMLNKVSSQELHVVNTTANSGWMFESGALINMTADELAAVGAKTGLVLEYRSGAQAPQKIKPNAVPTGLDRISSKSSQYFREISGIGEAMLGTNNPSRVSQVTLESQQKRGLVQLDVVFDNLHRSRRFRAEKMLELVQQFYSETRLVRTTRMGVDGREEVEELMINQPTPEGEVLNNLTMGEYAVVINSMPSRDTVEETAFAQMMELRTAGVMIPDDAIIATSQLEEKHELAERVRQMIGQTEPTEQEVQMMQMQQELSMQMLVAQVDEARAKAQERLANVQLLMAKAAETQTSGDRDMEQLGAKLRADLEKQMIELQTTREELSTRLQLMREKNEAGNKQAQIGAFSKMLVARGQQEVQKELSKNMKEPKADR